MTEHEKWLKERNEVIYSLDVAKFKKFYAKWTRKGVYQSDILPADEVIEITMRKMICSLRNPDPEKYKEAKRWLTVRGYTPSI